METKPKTFLACYMLLVITNSLSLYFCLDNKIDFTIVYYQWSGKFKIFLIAIGGVISEYGPLLEEKQIFYIKP